MTALSWDDIKKRREPAKVNVTICLSQQIIEDLARLDEELVAARSEDLRHEGEIDYAPKAIELADRIVELEAEAAEMMVEFVFQEIPRSEWNALKRSHGPTQEQRQRGIVQYNPDTFTPAAIAACAVAPELTEDQAKELCAEWSEGDVQRLFMAVLTANVGERHVPKSEAASEVIRRHGAGSGRPSDSESPQASLMDG